MSDNIYFDRLMYQVRCKEKTKQRERAANRKAIADGFKELRQRMLINLTH